jgi:LPXTG-motif cell wall-anchored protein
MVADASGGEKLATTGVDSSNGILAAALALLLGAGMLFVARRRNARA